MRPRHVRPLLATIRPAKDRTSDSNVFGDAPIIASENRKEPFKVLLTVSWNRNEFVSSDFGQGVQKRATAILWKKDLRKSGRTDYVPDRHDIFDLGTEKLFVINLEPIGQQRLGLGNEFGGFHGWRITLSDSNPEQRAATSYD